MVDQQESDEEADFYYEVMRLSDGMRTISPAVIDMLAENREQWPSAVGGLIKAACSQSSFSDDNISMLLMSFPEGGFSWNQLRSVQMLTDNSLTWSEKFLKCIQLNAHWACRKMLETMEPNNVVDALELSKLSRQSKNLKDAINEKVRQRFPSSPSRNI